MAQFQQKNPHLKEMDEDMLYHLGFSTKTYDFKKQFGHTKVVISSGSPTRISEVAEKLAKAINVHGVLDNLAAKGGRFDMFQVGPVLLANHGMGVPSMSILVHELIKLVKYAECKDVIFVRMGTSGGLGIEPGTIVVTSEAVNGKLEPNLEQIILGKEVKRPTKVDKALVQQIIGVAKKLNISIVEGKTMCANDFYEEQSRLDGALCEYQMKDKFDFLNRAHSQGVRNLEMESLGFASLCYRADIPVAIICAIIVNRLKGDQVKHTPEVLNDIEHAPVRLVIELVKERCGL